MLLKKLTPLILILILSGCQTRTDKVPKINLPEMPTISLEAVKEVESVCIPRKKCDNLNNWLNELYIFRVKYNIYKEELEK
jgi:uncharacterized lipoprotein YajG